MAVKVKERSPGRWRLTWELGRHPVTGRRHQRTETLRGTRAKAERRWRAVQTEIDAGRAADPAAHTVNDLLDLLAATRWPHVARTTATNAAQLARDYLRPTLGAVRLRDLRPERVEAAYRAWRSVRQPSQPLAPRTVAKIHGILVRAAAEGVRVGWIGVNPMTVVRLPRPQAAVPELWTAEEWARLWGAVAPTPRGMAVWLAATTGLRMGELTAVRWQDYDAGAGTLRVARTLLRLPGPDPQWGPPKTRASARVIRVDRATQARLAAHRVAQARQRLAAGPAWHDYDLIVPRADGQPEMNDALTPWFQRQERKAGVRVLRWHDLRHYHASLLIAQGVPIPVVSARLGHASPAITMQVYAHLIGRGDDAALASIEAFFGASGTALGTPPGAERSESAPRRRFQGTRRRSR